jgi:divalent metal cation (Fe/Co/Zn/Cd) transporter
MATTVTEIQPIEHGPQHAELIRRGRRLEYVTVGYNVIEATISIIAGAAAGSIALLGFGIDAVIEASSGLIMLWRLQHGHVGERREALALRLVGGSLLLLAAYVCFEALRSLWFLDAPDETPLGVGIAAVSVMIMPWIARAKRRVAAQLNSRSLHADSRQTALCAYLSAILLVGTGLHWAFGWWWADPLAALCMAPIIAREGWEAFQGRTCCDCHAP